MSLKSWWEKYAPHVGISSLIISFIGLVLWFMTWENRSTKWTFYVVIGVIVLFFFWIIRWCFRFKRMNKHVFLAWQQRRFAKKEKVYATKMREACSKMLDYQIKRENKQKVQEKVWMELLDNAGEVRKARKRQEMAGRFSESTRETHQAALERRIRVLIWLINCDQLDMDENPYKAIRDKYIPYQIHLRDDSDIYFR